jgi:hypothetical protein
MLDSGTEAVQQVILAQNTNPPWGHLSDYVNKTPQPRNQGVLFLRVRISPPGTTNRPALPEYQHANSVRQLGRLVCMIHHPQDMERVASNSAILLSLGWFTPVVALVAATLPTAVCTGFMLVSRADCRARAAQTHAQMIANGSQRRTFEGF